MRAKDPVKMLWLQITRQDQRKGWGLLAPGALVAYQTVGEGPEAKDLTIGKVLLNHRDEQAVTLQPYRGK